MKQVDKPTEYDDHEDEGDGTPGPDPPVAFLFLSQGVHGKGFQKGYHRRIKYTVSNSDDDHRPKINRCKIQEPDQCAEHVAADVNRPAETKPIGQCAPDQGEYYQHQRSECRQRADLGTAESEVIAVKVKIREVDAEHPEIQEVLRTDDQQG